MAVLFLKFLGRFGARLSSGEAAEIWLRKGQALLAYLALNPEDAIARSRVSALLWGDYADERARANLRETLNVLRKALGSAQDQVLLADRESIGLDGAALDVDALTFADLIARGAPEDLEAAVSLYRGDLLDGMDISAPGFQAWLEEERRRYGDLMAGALATLMALKRAEGARQDAIFLAQRLLAMDPLREDIHRTLMGLYADLGQRQSALQQYQRCRDVLASELAVAPEPETEALHRTLLNGDWAGAGLAGARVVVVPGRRDIRAGLTVKHRADHRAGSAGAAGVVRGSRRRATVAGRVLVLAGVAALSWLLAWSYTAVQPLPNISDFLKIDALSSGDLAGVPNGVSDPSTPAGPNRVAPSLGAGTSLAAAAPDGLDGLFGLSGASHGAPSFGAELSLAIASIDDSWGEPEGLSESSGPALPDRSAPLRPAKPDFAVAPMGDLSGALAYVTLASGSLVPAETNAESGDAGNAHLAMQREADGLWPGLAESWDLHAVRAFRADYPEAEQAAEADLRIAFLVQRRRDAQAELNRLGYNAGPVDGIWGPRSMRAMRALQSDNGLAPEGVVSKASLDRLNSVPPNLKLASIQAPEVRPQPISSESEAAVAPPSAQVSIPHHSRWTASGRSHEGSRIFATATRRGDTLKLSFDVDHRDVANREVSKYSAQYTQNCTISVADPVSECWITGLAGYKLGARVLGTFPRLLFIFRQEVNAVTSGLIPADVSRAGAWQ